MSKIRVADYIVKTMADHGVRHAFMVTGGGAMHLNDAVAKETRIKAICNHHEQASAMAAEAYARIEGRLCLVNVTTGPGGLNALNGVFGAWTDSIPMVIVSGQVKRETLMASYPALKLRQLGDQEVDIVRIAAPITKYAVSLTDPNRVRWEVEKLMHLAKHGRPGPCWLDVPVDVQASIVETDSLEGYNPGTEAPRLEDQQLVQKALQKLNDAKRPVLLVGHGVRLAGAVDVFFQWAERLRIPICTAWLQDYVPTDHPLFCGIQGSVGDRAGNFVVQNSDCVCIIGARLPIRQLSYNWKSFAREAFKVHVDIDPSELNKPTLAADLPIAMDSGRFIKLAEEVSRNSWVTSPAHEEWLKWSQERKRRYVPAITERQRTATPKINPYLFFGRLFAHLNSDDIAVAGDGAASVMAFPVARMHKGQRFFTNTGAASMGYDLPAAIGAATAAPERRVICIAGDGSIQMNIQELQTIVHHKMNIKIMVLNNNGYLSIRSTQKNFFGRMLGESAASGLSFPDIIKVAQAYGLPAIRIEGPQFEAQLTEILRTPGPALAEVIVDPEQSFEPKLGSRQLPDGKMVSSPLEDLSPLLDREEFFTNMLIKPAKD